MPGDHDAAFEALFKYYPAVVSLLRKMDFDHEDARDLAQQVFLRVYEHMDAYRGEAKWHYLEQVTRRLAYNDRRDRHAAKREGIRVATEEIIEFPDERTPAADATLESEETSQRIWWAVNQLTPSDQTAIRLQMAGLSQDAIARELGITVSALKSRLNVARKRLRVLLGEEPEGLDGRK
jgi:RNA polymerase sigma-70 factor (ECF subfamily)